MNRRGFLSVVAQAVAAGLILPDLAKELILPERTIVLPPVGGWPAGNQLLSVNFIINEILRTLDRQLVFARHMDAYDTFWDALPAKQQGLIVRAPRHPA